MNMRGRSRKQRSLLTDSPGYRGTDSGCRRATNFLKAPSRCRECPFEKCRLS